MTHTTHNDEAIVKSLLRKYTDNKDDWGVDIIGYGKTKQDLRQDLLKALAKARADQDKISRAEEREHILEWAKKEEQELVKAINVDKHSANCNLHCHWCGETSFVYKLRSFLTTQYNNTV